MKERMMGRTDQMAIGTGKLAPASGGKSRRAQPARGAVVCVHYYTARAEEAEARVAETVAVGRARHYGAGRCRRGRASGAPWRPSWGRTFRRRSDSRLFSRLVRTAVVAIPNRVGTGLILKCSVGNPHPGAPTADAFTTIRRHRQKPN